jgi:hypothetical protein
MSNRINLIGSNRAETGCVPKCGGAFGVHPLLVRNGFGGVGWFRCPSVRTHCNSLKANDPTISILIGASQGCHSGRSPGFLQTADVDPNAVDRSWAPEQRFLPHT